MEYIDGATLADWLAEAPRSWQDILAMYLQAGAGLAAAHQAGLSTGTSSPTMSSSGETGGRGWLTLAWPGWRGGSPQAELPSSLSGRVASSTTSTADRPGPEGAIPMPARTLSARTLRWIG